MKGVSVGLLIASLAVNGYLSLTIAANAEVMALQAGQLKDAGDEQRLCRAAVNHLNGEVMKARAGVIEL